MPVSVQEQLLLDAFVALVGQEDKAAALQQVIDLACDVTQARRGAAYLRSNAQPSAMAHVGMTDEQLARLSPYPVVSGVRVGDRLAARDAIGALTPAPDDHAAVVVVAAVPIRTRGSTDLGTIYIAGPRSASGFSDVDLRFVEALGHQAGHAIALTPAIAESQDLLERLQVAERLRSHAVQGLRADDPLTAIDRILAVAQSTLSLDLAFVTRLHGSTQSFEFLSQDSNSFGWHPGLEMPADEGYCSYMVAGELPHVVPDCATEPIARRLPVTADARLGAYVGVPITMPDGRLYGGLCAVSHTPEAHLGGVDEEVLHVLSALVSDQLVLLERQDAERVTRLAEIQTLLAPGGLSMVAQPIVELRTGCVCGVEALARFAGHPNGPSGVFSAAAHLGLRTDFELAALSAALDLLPDVPDPLYVSLNASPVTVLDPRFGPLLAAAPADRIVLELTEHIEVPDYDDLIAALDSVRARGIRLAIDDAGSGFASLAHILTLAPDIIKLDIALTHGVDGDPARRALASALVGFAADLGALLIAEGVETHAELTTLRDLGVTCGQGFHLGRPARPATLDLTKTVYVGDERRRSRPWANGHPAAPPDFIPSQRPAV